MKAVRHTSGFTLIELLVVMTIMGILAGLAIPAIKNFGKSEAQISATRQMLDDVARARQLAISQRTTIYMIFLPASFWSDASYAGNTAAFNALSQVEKDKAAKLYDKQLNSYAFVTVRSVGDQPGQPTVRYVGSWHSLPEGTFIPAWKFAAPAPANNQPQLVRAVTDPPPPATPVRATYPVKGFNVTVRDDGVPFPSADGSIGFRLPYLAFDSRGTPLGAVDTSSSSRQRFSSEDAYIPLARGSIGQPLDANKVPTQNPPSVQEKPVGNSTNSFNLIHVEWLTGRAKVERQEIP